MSVAPLPYISSDRHSQLFHTSSLSPTSSIVLKALHLTKLQKQDSHGVPVKETSGKRNAYYAAFHTLCSGLGIQALVLPLAFSVVGWTWGIIILSSIFIWQLYTLYIMVQLHEDLDKGVRYCKYMQLAAATFGNRLSKFVSVLPIGSMGASVIIGGSTCKIFFESVSAPNYSGPNYSTKPLTNVEWYLVFTTAIVLLSQLPNLNSIVGFSLVGAITAVGYTTSLWTVSVAGGRINEAHEYIIVELSLIQRISTILNAVGIIAFAFGGHSHILEIQATLPSDEDHPSRVPMWNGVKMSYTLIALCLFPLSIGGYWVYGEMIPEDGGILRSLYFYHGIYTRSATLGLISFLIIINALSSYQIYAMPMFIDIESTYTARFNKPCSWWLRAILRAVFGYLCFFIAVAIPFVSSFAGLIGGITLPVTLAYPCFMWLKIKKHKPLGFTWCLNWALGIFGMCLSALLVASNLYVVIDTGVDTSFFKLK